jgi:iron complex transport system substrate-binding protein
MRKSLLLFLPFMCLLFTACNSGYGGKENASENRAGQGLSHATRFILDRREGYTILTVTNPWQGAERVNHVWYLVRDSTTVPEEADPSKIIRVPVRRIIAMSTTYLPMITALGEGKSIVGVSGTDLIYDETIRKEVLSGTIAEVGYEDNLDKELVVTLSPGVVMAYGVGGEASGYLGKLKELGIRVVFNADYLEPDPLAKAEWIKVFGALYCREDEADRIYNEVADEYLKIKSLVAERTTARPVVMLGLPWKDTWYVSPGNSFMRKLINDAGGKYLWEETVSDISMPLGMEKVWLRASGAEFWLNIGTASFRDEIVAADYRLGELPPFRNGKLYNNNNRVYPDGGNDYWESGSINPHLVLKDIASILHPGLFDGYKQYYYRKVNDRYNSDADDTL